MSKGTGILVFRLVFTLVIFAVQWYLYRRTIAFVGDTKGFPRWSKQPVAVLFVLFNVPFLIFLFQRPFYSAYSNVFFHIGVLPFYVWHGATFFIFLVLGIAAILRILLHFFLRLGTLNPSLKRKIDDMKSNQKFQEFDKSRRTFLKTGGVALSAYSFIGATQGVIDRGEFDITERTVHIRNLPEEFKGFTIGVMSDIHSSAFMTKPEMDDYVAALNNLKTDLIVVPGDFVNSQTEEVYPFVESFSALRAPHGVYGCLGNHDYFANVDVVAKEVDGCGVKLLRNDAVVIQKGASFINLVGVDDIPMNGKPDSYIARALSSVHNANPKILLCHKPYFLETFAAHQIDLTLSGHTHGGQVVFAKVGNTYISPATLFSKYVWGLYKHDNSQMYVTRGIGTVGVPFRINCPPEITKITLQ